MSLSGSVWLRRAPSVGGIFLTLALSLGACASAPVPASKPPPSTASTAITPSTRNFADWLEGVKAEALARGISANTVRIALQDVGPNARVIELDRRQPEFIRSFWGYFDRAVSPERVERGRAKLVEHAPMLHAVSSQTGIPATILVALWGVETNYGSNLGGFSVIEALATLAWDGRRGAFFREELFSALSILDEGHISPARMVGSWAGAMGQMQFMPTTFQRHAVDRDGDGRKDIWGNLNDAFGSAGHFLANLGWRPGQDWGWQVVLPAGFDFTQSDLDVRKPLATWAALGVRRADGGPLPTVSDITASVLVPAGHEGPAFLVLENFRVLLRWNNSTFYALAVGRLSDRLAGDGPLVGAFDRSADPLRLVEVTELQRLLNALGHAAGTVDGLVGPGTRGAIRRFQESRAIVADGHADRTVLAQVRQEAARRGIR